MSKTYRESSKLDWTPAGGVQPDREQVRIGCLQRIADATETMAKRFTDLQDEALRWRTYAADLEACMKARDRTIRGLRGALTKAKRKAARQ